MSRCWAAAVAMAGWVSASCAQSARPVEPPAASLSEDVCLTFSDFATRAPDGTSADRWSPGSPAQLEVVLINTCRTSLTSYPSAWVESSDPRVTIKDSKITLYGLGPGQRYPLKFLARASADIPVGARVTLSFSASPRGLTGRGAGAPVTFAAEIGAAFASQRR